MHAFALSRSLHHAGEQNFHLLYYVFHAPNAAELGLTSQRNFEFLGNIGGVDYDEPAMLKEVVTALYDIGFSRKDQEDIFRILASVLHMGNINFQEVVSVACL